MEVLNRYISGIVIACVLAILLENILPETHHKKYINVTIGLVVMLIIIKPLTGIRELNPVFKIPETIIDDEDLSTKLNRKTVAREFEKRLAQVLTDEVRKECGKESKILVFVSVNENDELTGIARIEAYPVDEEIKEVIAKTAGVSPEIIKEKN